MLGAQQVGAGGVEAGEVRRARRWAPPSQYESSMIRPFFDASMHAAAPSSSGLSSLGWSIVQPSRKITVFSNAISICEAES